MLENFYLSILQRETFFQLKLGTCHIHPFSESIIQSHFHESVVSS